MPFVEFEVVTFVVFTFTDEFVLSVRLDGKFGIVVLTDTFKLEEELFVKFTKFIESFIFFISALDSRTIFSNTQVSCSE